MPEAVPVAFLSYVRSDDDHDSGRITELRIRLEGEIKMQTGAEFHIFQDRNDISWGKNWKERIQGSIYTSTFLIPIITPSYFFSESCRMEFNSFLYRENVLGENRLILPIYYVSHDDLESTDNSSDDIVSILKTRNWIDWRNYRFEPLDSPKIRSEIANLATTLKRTTRELAAIFAAAQHSPTPPERVTVERSKADPATPILEFKEKPPVVVRGKFDKKRLSVISRENYYIYTNDYDEIINPSQLTQSKNIIELHSNLTNIINQEINIFEDVIDYEIKNISRAEKNTDLCIVFLLDNSGSLRGPKIRAMASGISVVSSALAQANIACEVLGFTTRAWKGGRSRERWLIDGKPEKPGRLNDIRHIVYKDIHTTHQEADLNFGLLMMEGLLKENIDGEAILWANERIQSYPQKRKIIIVISDGAPVDDCTLSVNQDNFLKNHLLDTLKWVNSISNTEIYGIGIGSDPTHFYGERSATLSTTGFIPDILKVSRLILDGNLSELSKMRRNIDEPVEISTDALESHLASTRIKRAPRSRRPRRPSVTPSTPE